MKIITIILHHACPLLLEAEVEEGEVDMCTLQITTTMKNTMMITMDVITMTTVVAMKIPITVTMMAMLFEEEAAELAGVSPLSPGAVGLPRHEAESAIPSEGPPWEPHGGAEVAEGVHPSSRGAAV